jgi:hypothetical protein
MNEEPKSIWKKSWKGWRGLLLWMASLTVFMFLLTMIVLWLLPGRKEVSEMVGIALIDALAVGVLAVLIVVFVRSLCCWRNFKRFLFGLSCFITLVALFYAEEDWRGKHAWENFKREWEAKGERFDRASVIPPAVPDDQNFALTPIVFTSYGQMLTREGREIPFKDRDTNFVNRLDMNIYYTQDNAPTNGDWRVARITDLRAWQRYYREVAAKTNLFPVPAQPQSPAADVLLALSKYDSTIEELREAAKLPYSRFPLEYDKDDPWAILLPHLAQLKKCSQVLQLRALAELQNGQSDQALADVKLMLRLVDSIRTEPFLISHLVRIVMVNIALQPVWEGLSEHRWSDTQLTELDRELAQLNFLSSYNLAMRSELVLSQTAAIDNLRRHPETINELFNNFSGSSSSSPVRVVDRLIPTGWFYQNQIRCARLMVEFYLPVADTNQRTVSPALVRQSDAAVEADIKQSTPYNFIESALMPALGKAVRKFANGQCSVDLARTAIALERYRLVHGEFPDKLDALTPQFIAKLPHDVIGGQPLHYRRTADGQFILYSVGWNETDDDGKVVLNEHGAVDIGAGDWVWRYPAQ